MVEVSVVELAELVVFCVALFEVVEVVDEIFDEIFSFSIYAFLVFSSSLFFYTFLVFSSFFFLIFFTVVMFVTVSCFYTICSRTRT